MNILYFFIAILIILNITIAMCFDTRRPMSTKLKYKYRVKDDSIFRKIIKFKDEEKLLKDADDADKVYVEDVLPLKMKINLEYTEKFNIFFDLKVMFMTVIAVLK